MLAAELLHAVYFDVLKKKLEMTKVTWLVLTLGILTFLILYRAALAFTHLALMPSHLSLVISIFALIFLAWLIYLVRKADSNSFCAAIHIALSRYCCPWTRFNEN